MPASSSNFPGHVLVVSGNEAYRETLVRALKAVDYTTSAAADVEQSLDRLQNEFFDCVLVDVHLPNGLERVLAYLREQERWELTPVLAVSALDEAGRAARALDLGAADYIVGAPDPALLRARLGLMLELKRWRAAARAALSRLEAEQKRVEELLQIVIPLGVTLSAETDFNQMLEKILAQAQTLCNADAGTLYWRADDDRLQFVILRNRSLNLALGGTSGAEIPFAPLPLNDALTGRPNHHNVATHAALSGETVNIPDAYRAEGFDFSGTQAFDRNTGYHSTSFLTVPLKDSRQQVIGVLQLINALDPRAGGVIPFAPALHPVVESLASLATVALQAYIREQRLRRQIEELRIEIDEGRRSRQVAEITETDYFRRLQEKAREMRLSVRGGTRPLEPRQ